MSKLESLYLIIVGTSVANHNVLVAVANPGVPRFERYGWTGLLIDILTLVLLVRLGIRLFKETL